MMLPIRQTPYKLDVPLTAKERKENEKARMKGLPVPHQRIRGTFFFKGFGKNSKNILLFRGQATMQDGVIYAAPTVVLSLDDFSLGIDLGKIRGRTRRVRRAN